MSSFKYRPDIDGLRAIAVLPVVGFHAFPTSVPGGFVGVDVFFVISGFLISGIILDQLQRNTFSFADFYVRRAKRILPALVLVLVACYVIASRIMLSGDFKALGKHLIGAGTFVINFLLWNESGYFDVAAQSKPLLHLWSLGIEEQFYLIWPALLFAFFRWKLKISYLLFGILCLSFAINVITVEHSTAAAFYSPASRFWELMCGATIAYGAPNGLKAGDGWRPEAESVIGLLFMIGPCFLFTDRLRFPGWWALIPVFGASLVIHAGPNTFVNKSILSSRPLVWVGLISYGLYLWHWPLLSLAHIAAGQDPSRMARIGLVIASVALATATYQLVERPIRYWHGYEFVKVSGLATVTLLVVCLGTYTVARDGLVTATQRALVIRYVEMKDDWRGGQCLIGPDNGWPISEAAGADNFSNCIESDERPLLILWGDSYAAHLYPGIKYKQTDRNFRIAQFNLNACPPLIGLDVPGRTYCTRYQDELIRKIIALRPTYLVIASAWGMVQPMPTFLTQLRATMDQIRSNLPTTRVTVVGNPPIWKERLPSLLQKLSVVEDGRIVDGPEIRLNGQTDPSYDHDQELSSLAGAYHFSYFSPMGVLCDKSGCLSREGYNFDNLFSMDTGHLTPVASRLVGEQLIPSVVGSASQAADHGDPPVSRNR
jgi:peptidoglycan/LPS O-acetylase OafA/YrhL